MIARWKKREGHISLREKLEQNQRAICFYQGVPYVENDLQKALPPKRDRIRRPVDDKPVVYEKDVQKAILEALALRKDVVFAGRFNRGQSVAQSNSGHIRYTQFNTVKGFPDIHGLLLGGRAFYIEVKRPGGGRESEDQRRFLDKALGGGALAGVARSVEEAMQILPPFRP